MPITQKPMGYVQKFPANAKRYVPLARVSFHTDTACYQAKGEFVGLDGMLDPTNQVLTITTQKNLSSPAGAFTLTLTGNDWQQKLKSNDLVVISMGYKGEKTVPTVMVGLIDTVRSFRRVSDNGATVTTTVQGRDFGKILIKSMLKFYPELGQANPEAQKSGQKFFLTDEGWMTMMSFFTNDNIVKGTPATILDNIMRFILPKLNDVTWTTWDEGKKVPTPKKVKVGNVLRYNFGKVDIFLPMILTADQFEGSIWNLMDRTSIKPFTELFVDTRSGDEAWSDGSTPRVVNEEIEQASSPDKASLPDDQGKYPSPRSGFGDDNSAVMVAMRNTPFDSDLWTKLYQHDLPAEDVIDEDLSFSDNEHYNLFWAGTTITPFGSNFNLKKVSPPLYNQDMVTRYGLSPLEVQVEGLAIDASDPSHQTLLTEVSSTYSKKLKDWYEFNHEMLTGSMTVRGKGNYRVGQRLLRKGIQREFYIEGVNQVFNVFTNWETALQLTRGKIAK